MKRLFLTSSVNFVAQDIAKRIDTKGKKLAFILTPTEVEEGDLQWLKDDRKSLVDAGFVVTDYTFTGKTKEEIESFLSEFDIIFVSGGNTFYAMEQIQKTDSKNLITNLVDNGKIYIGSSAGSVIAGPDIFPTKDLDDLTKAPDLKGYEGLGFTNLIIFPHWGSENFKQRYLNACVKNAYTEKRSIILLPNDSYVLVENDKFEIIKV